VAQSLDFSNRQDISFVANPDGSSTQTTTSDQKFESQEARAGKGLPFLGTVSNHAASADTLLFAPSGALTGLQDRKSSQDYFRSRPTRVATAGRSRRRTGCWLR
jgi:hypothetical protein